MRSFPWIVHEPPTVGDECGAWLNLAFGGHMCASRSTGRGMQMGIGGFAKVTGTLGAALFVGSAVGLLGAAWLALGAIVLLVGAVSGAVALEERDAIEGLVTQQVSPLAPLVTDDLEAPESVPAA